jgi:hypothetical protein
VHVERPSDPVLLAGLTATSYLMAFAYEVGAANAFAIPPSFIDLQLVPAISQALFALSVLGIMYNALGIVVPLVTAADLGYPLAREMRPMIALLTILFAFWLVGGDVIARQLAAALVFVLAMFLFRFLFPLLVFRRIPGYIAKLRVSQEVDDQVQRPFDSIIDSFSPAPVLLGAILLLSLFSLTAGYAHAKRTKEFFITNLNPETVVLRTYGGRLVTAEFKRDKKTITRRYRVLKIEDPNLVLRREDVGPLAVE